MSSAITLSRNILTAAIEQHASDIHFYPFNTETDIFFRINGKRVFYKKISTNHYQLLLTYYKFSSGMDIGETRKPQNGTIQHHDTSMIYSLRFSTLPTNQLESLAVRVLPQKQTHSLNELFLFPSQYKQIKKWVKRRSGIILITGPTGSGKTTTLYSLVHSLLQEDSYQTISLEDPIEKEMQDIIQVQINEKAGITYQTGLKAALRHDPDILMVGEIRDEYTAKFAFEAALTGHLVMSTLHAKNSIGTIHRLRDLDIKEIDLQHTLIAVASIQLVPIQINKKVMRRAAILEILDGEILDYVLKGGDVKKIKNYHSFQHLRKKAYAYGFISKETLFELQVETE
ncbi:competence type IV pilus ATPase ComGA [Oceanobacillus caeni]|uniref:Competence protein n=1 Tax=Oceanobacillus caeni TaxID=405946 RepID=A0ABR5MGR1_9BACI|nr:MULTISPECIES: competence type IV pilus ATPase ComGA [Bacillaceae]KKE80641.1 competence protein [Bacilli bacterium VT-13-104]PZD86905.1 competence protein [Bacilli bacterium]KPH71782.1 competence protein [Oceanobacillus caeni]MBU8789843.1 Flp pilus assembly complex ATPase component TadA [Oceanobacillus caeni]MCR1834952.1 competence type IV pilus ATPase ComGA [Oceanobacillus caeni]